MNLDYGDKVRILTGEYSGEIGEYDDDENNEAVVILFDHEDGSVVVPFSSLEKVG